MQNHSTAVAKNYPTGEALPKKQLNTSQEQLRRLRQNYKDYQCENCGRKLKHHSVKQLVDCNDYYEENY